MKAFVCEICGSNDVIKINGEYVCQYCGTKYSVDEAKKIYADAVRIDNSEKINNLLILARRAKETNNVEDASKYYGLLLMEEPNNKEAQIYDLLYRAVHSTKDKFNENARLLSDGIISIIKSEDFGLTESICTDTSKWIVGVSEEIMKDMTNAMLRQIDAMMNNLDAIYGSNDFVQRNKADRHAKEVDRQTETEFERIHSQIDSLQNFVEKVLEELSKYPTEEVQKPITEMRKALDAVYYMRVRVGKEKAPTRLEAIQLVNNIKKYEPGFEGKCVPQILKMEQAEKENQSKTQQHTSINSSSVTTGGGTSGGCYIATCVYGSYDCPEVWTLRRFRDYALSKTLLGRTFINVYYATSPKLIRRYGDQTWFKNMWRKLLDFIVNNLNKQGYSNTPYVD